MRQITEKDYQKIQRLTKRFYDGVDRYCETLEDTYKFIGPFEEIIEIIDDAERK